MRRDQIMHLAVEQYQHFVENFSLSLVSDEAEYIHQFRVAVKKLNAIEGVLLKGRALKYSGLSDDRLWSFIQPVYKTGGKVRTLQVILDVLSTFVTEPPSDFKFYLYDRLREKRLGHDNMAGAIELLSEKAFYNALKAFVEKSCHSDFDGLEAIIRGQGEQAAYLIQSNPAGESWHEARRYFKGSAHLIQLANSVGELVVEGEAFNRYREMEQLLGSWHDFYMLNKLIAKYTLLRGERQDAEWTAFIKEKTETALRMEEDVCLLADTFNVSEN